MGFIPLLEVSDEDTSLGDSLTDSNYSAGCVAHTETVLAQPSLCKVKPFPGFTSNAAPILDYSWSFLMSKIRHSSPGWLIGWCLAV